jgi:hypothetical protein
MGVREIRTGILLGLGCLLAGVGPFVVSEPALQRLAAAAAFSVPAVAPFFFRVREVGIAAAVVAGAAIAFASVGGLIVAGDAHRTVVVRTFQMASAGAFAGGLAGTIAWLRHGVRTRA